MTRTLAFAALLLATPMAAHAQAHTDHSRMDHSKMDHSKMGHGKMDHSKMDHAAMGHSGLKASVPADGAVVSGSPKTITLTLDHAMVMQSVTLTNAAGQRIPMPGALPKEAVTTVTLPVRPLTPGAYTVAWTAGGGDHSMKGNVRFTVK